jgi:hypothetical protein
VSDAEHYRAELAQARALAFLTLMGRACELEEIERAPSMKEFARDEIEVALLALRLSDRVEKKIQLIRYRPGDKWLRRDVVVYTVRRA